MSGKIEKFNVVSYNPLTPVVWNSTFIAVLHFTGTVGSATLRITRTLK